MPHTNNWKEYGLIRDFTGTISGSEIIESNLKMHGDSRFDHINYVINDFSKIEDCLISEDELEMMSITDEIAEHSNRYLKIALIVTQEAFIELAQIYCEMMRDATYDAEIFDNIEDAHGWVSQ